METQKSYFGAAEVHYDAIIYHPLRKKNFRAKTPSLKRILFSYFLRTWLPVHLCVSRNWSASQNTISREAFKQNGLAFR